MSRELIEFTTTHYCDNKISKKDEQKVSQSRFYDPVQLMKRYSFRKWEPPTEKTKIQQNNSICSWLLKTISAWRELLHCELEVNNNIIKYCHSCKELNYNVSAILKMKYLTSQKTVYNRERSEDITILCEVDNSIMENITWKNNGIHTYREW